MANTFITMQNIARQTLMRLTENLVMPALTYKDFSDTFTDLGDTIQVRKPTKLVAKEFTDGNSVERQDIKEESITVKLDKIATVDVQWGALEGAVNMSEQKLMKDFSEPAAVALAQKMNADGLAMYAQVPNYLGTPGTTPDGLDDFSAIRKFLNKNKAPLTGRKAVWDVEADAKFTEISGLTKVSEAGTSQTLREGEIGRLYGLDNYMSQAVNEVTASTLTAGGTSASGVKVKSAVTAGTEVTLISNASASGTLTGSVEAGEVIAFTHSNATVYATVAEAATAASNELKVKLIQAVTLSANDAAELKSFTANLAFHQNAIAFVTRPLRQVSGVECYTATDSENGISVRVYKGFNTETKKEVMSMDVLYAYALVYPELAAVYFG